MTKTLLFLPGPVPVAQSVLSASARPLIGHRGPEFAAILQQIEERLKPVFGTSGPIALLGASGTGGLEAAVVNMFSPGDRLLSCPVGVFGKRLAAIAQTYGCTVEILDTPLGYALDAQRLTERLHRDIADHPDPQDRFRGVLLTHNETSTGVQNKMAKYASILREHGAISLVDSVSGLGASEFKMDEWGYDIVVSASQKAFAAPPGVAIVALGKRAVARLQNASIPRFYFDLSKALDSSEKGQTPWTPPVSVVFALDVALELYAAQDAAVHWKRHERHAEMIRDGLVKLGFTIFSQPDARSVTVVAAIPPQGVDAIALLKTLREEHHVVLSGGQGELTGKVVRMGAMGDIDERDITQALDAIASCVMVAEVR